MVPQLRGLRYKLAPTGEQRRLLARWAGCCRYVFNAGLAHEGLGCMESAIASYQRSYEAAESVGGKDAMGHACKVLTKVQMHREEWLEAEATARRGLALFEETGERRQSGQMTSLLSKILSHGGRREEALDFLERGLEMARDIESPEREMEVRSGRAELFAAMGDHERAYLELGLVRELEREVFALSKAEQIAQLESSHQSARKELEADFLRERAARLEEEVNARTRELREKHRQLQLAQHAKDCFLAMVGHELRTPLNTIIGFTEMAQEELLSLQGGAQAREDLGEVLSAGATLSDLIEKILELSSAASGETALQLSRVALPEFLENALQEHERLARLQGNQAHLEIALARPDIETDPERLRVLLRALLENAHKFTSAGVVCLRAHEEGESLHLTVTDTGVGMEPEMLRRVFEPFEQAELTSNRVMDGAGLGLTLVRHHAALLGGDLSVESVQGEGSSFRVTLPWRLT